MVQATQKDPAQRTIEYLALGIWLTLTLITLISISKSFALGVFLGGLICTVNNQWLGKHAREAMALPHKFSAKYMILRYALRMVTLGALLVVLIVYAKVNILGLLLGLSVVMLSIISYACYNYIFHNRGE